jgi:hypothetical protein
MTMMPSKTGGKNRTRKRIQIKFFPSSHYVILFGTTKKVVIDGFLFQKYFSKKREFESGYASPLPPILFSLSTKSTLTVSFSYTVFLDGKEASWVRMHHGTK